jgi:hypothetical protein
LAWDILPPEQALADVRRACPELLPRIVYVQVRPDTLITPGLVRDMLAGLCDAGFADVVEMMCGAKQFETKSLTLFGEERVAGSTQVSL